MPKPASRAHRIVGLFLAACLLFNYPLLAVFNVSGTVWGVPILYAYLFTAWGIAILLAALVVDGRE
ncbi:MAG TPA: hypothetical protein PLD37_06000 [Usitatibacteraceae bacterium]|nr:hypothetical protein [Usitatibacteraceae bacterium]